METIILKNAAGLEVVINKPKKKALAELALAIKEERAPVLSEQDREDAANYNKFIADGYAEPKAGK